MKGRRPRVPDAVPVANGQGFPGSSGPAGREARSLLDLTAEVRVPPSDAVSVAIGQGFPGSSGLAAREARSHLGIAAGVRVSPSGPAHGGTRKRSRGLPAAPGRPGCRPGLGAGGRLPALGCLLVVAVLGVGALPVAAQEPSDPPPPRVERPVPEPAEPTSPGAPFPGATAQGTVRPDGGRVQDDPRSAVLVRRECTSELDREELTLFANGTVRLRQGPPGEEQMDLGELTPDELDTYVGRLWSEDLGETDLRSSGPVGAWVSRCRLELDYDAMARWLGPVPQPSRDGVVPAGRVELAYGPYDSFSLALSRVLALVDGIAARVDRAVGRGLLPDDYAPSPGDVLRRADGILFRIERSTASKGGWELQGVEQPLTLFILEDEIPKLFVELVERR